MGVQRQHHLCGWKEHSLVQTYADHNKLMMTWQLLCLGQCLLHQQPRYRESGLLSRAGAKERHKLVIPLVFLTDANGHVDGSMCEGIITLIRLMLRAHADVQMLQSSGETTTSVYWKAGSTRRVSFTGDAAP